MPAKQILLLTLSGCVALFTIFICWVIYYVAMMLRDVRSMTKETHGRFKRFWTFCDDLKNKAEQATTVSSAVTRGIFEVVDYVKGKKVKKKQTKKKRSRTIKIAVK